MPTNQLFNILTNQLTSQPLLNLRKIGWYEEQQAGLGEYFLKDLENCYSEITKRPESYQKKYNDIRHALLRKSPFVVFFEILEERIVIYSVFHSSREPLSWKK